MAIRGKHMDMVRKEVVQISWREILLGRGKSKYEGPKTEKYSV